MWNKGDTKTLIYLPINKIQLEILIDNNMKISHWRDLHENEMTSQVLKNLNT